MREKIAIWLDQPIVRNGIIAVILFNAVILGLETSDPAMASAGGLILALDKLGDYGPAFEAFRRMGVETEKNPLARQVDPTTWNRLIKGYREHVTPELLARSAAEPVDDHRLRRPVDLGPLGLVALPVHREVRLVEVRQRVGIHDVGDVEGELETHGGDPSRTGAVGQSH